MRARDIKPGFFKNDILAECSAFARLLFIGLWMLADREGRLECRPKKIKAEILPYDSVDVDALLRELEEGGFIVSYYAGGMKLLWIPKFLKHQRPHQNEVQSVLPPYDGQSPAHQGFGPTAQTVEGLSTKVASPSHQGEKPLPPRDEPLRPSSLTPSSLSPSSLTPSSQSPESLPRPQGGRESSPKKTSPDLRLADFERWYAAFPRHQKKAEGQAAWEKGVKAGIIPDIETMLEVLSWQRNQDQWQNPKYIPLPASYLNAKQWTDEPLPDSPPRPRQNGLPINGNGSARRLTPEEEALLRSQNNFARYFANKRKEEDGEEDLS